MNARDALARLRVPAVRTAEAAVALGLSKPAATMTLSRLAGLVTPVRHGLWWIDGPIDPYRLAELLTAPFDSYLSLHTALHLHGLVEQIPEVFYVKNGGSPGIASGSVGAPSSWRRTLADLSTGLALAPPATMGDRRVWRPPHRRQRSATAGGDGA